MPYYHVYIDWNDEIGARWGKDVDFNVGQLNELINTIKRGVAVLLKGIKINPYGITKLKIWKTDERARGKSDTWEWISRHGENVTKDFIITLPIKPQSRKEEKVYPKGHIYDFYKDIRDITKDVKNEVFVIDGYVDEELLNLYLEKIPIGVKIRILTNKPQGNFMTVAQKFKTRPNIDFEVKESKDCHDRLFFIDNECWVTGQSVKDAGKKPTYLIKIEGYDLFRKVFDNLWKNASALI